MSKKLTQPEGGKASKGRQTTLFQTWGYEGNITLDASSSSHSGVKENKAKSEMMDDNDDDALSRALDEEFMNVDDECIDVAKLTSTTRSMLPSSTPLETLPGFDVAAGTTWVYPTNMSVRKYQMDIVEACLYENTLVCLPTGLGKTFIAAVVIYNFYRWYPQSKIIFMAPTKPLVAQQIEACYNIMGIPQNDTCEMTGNVNINSREKSWNSKRVFFLTPQVMSNDLARRSFPAEQVKVVIVDEAHRAQGDYAYCQVVRELVRTGQMFRVIALSATPGTDLNAVKLVIQNLMISHIEIRHEDSPDLKEYSHQRTIEKYVIPLDENLKKVQSIFRDCFLEPAIKRLGKSGVLGYRGNTTNPEHYSRWALLQARNEFRQNPPSSLDKSKKGMLERDFSNSISLYHAYELLTKHGLRSFYNFLQRSVGDDSSTPNNSRNDSPNPGQGVSPNIYINRILRYEMNQVPAFSEMMNELKHKFRKDSENSSLNSSRPKINSQFTQVQSKSSSPKEDFIVGHPKLSKLRDLIVEHFQNKEAQNVQTRAMIFSETRDSVTEINACLRSYRPLIRPMEFVGQAGKVGKRGLTQKEQVEVVRRFKEGNFNTMVSTCVGEEGLDIGEVDLIIFFDVSKSPIRLIQRMGRTGRKREGRVIVLLTEGKQEAIYNSAIYSKNSIKKALLDKNRLIPYLSRAPRMVPKGITPICHKMELKPQATFVGKKAAERRKSYKKQKEVESSAATPSVSTTTLVKDTSYAVSNGYLTTHELDEWTNKFKLNSEETIKVPKLKSRVESWCMSRNDIMEKLKTDQEKSAISAPNEIDLSEWILWQDSYQKRHYISQSKTSQLFENALDFIRNGNEVLTSLHPSTERQISLLQGADNYTEQNPEETEIPKTIDKEESGSPYKTNDANIEKIVSQSPIEFEKDLDERIGTPKHILDVVENEQSLLNEDDDDDDSQFWQSWFPIDEAVCKLSIRPVPDTMKMLKSIPDPKIIEAFDINASWKKIDKEFKDNSTEANVHTNLSAGCEFVGKPKCDSKSQDKCGNLSLNVMSKQMIKGYESLLTSTPSANIPRNTNLSNISPIINENSRLNTSRKLAKFRAIPEEDEENNEELESSNKTCQQNSVYTATQLVSFVNKTSLNATNDINTKNIQNPNIESRKLMKNKSGMIQNSVNLTAEERKIVQKLSFDDTDKISDSLKEAFSISYDDVVIRGCPILPKTPNPNSERNHVPCEIEQLSINSSFVSNNGRNCPTAHRTLNDLVECSSISKDISSDRQLYVSSFDIVLDDSISLHSESDISTHTFIHDTDFKLPDLQAYETKSKTPSRSKKQDKSPSKLSPARLEIDEKPIPSGPMKKNLVGYDHTDIPDHFDREVFSQLPPDIQNELLQNEGSNVSLHHTKSPDDNNIQSQIFVCKAKGKRVLISSSEEDLPSDSDSPIVNRVPKVLKKNSESDTSENDQRVNLVEMKNIPTSLKSSHCRARKFIDMEAVLSQSGDDFADSISEEAGIDGYEASFVDDATQKPTENIDQQAIYLRSVRSPVLQPIINRPPRKQMRREDIFSQFDDIEDEYDLQDSFVVDSDAIEYESKTDPLDFIDEFDDKRYKDPKTKGEKSKLKGRKRGRILTKACSSSSDEEQRGKYIGKPKRLLNTPKSDEKTTNDTVNESTHQNEINIDSEASIHNGNAGNIQPGKINVTETEEIKRTCSYESHLQSPKPHKPDLLTAPSVQNKDQQRHSVLISALELQKAQEVVSLLRHDHGINVVVSRTGIDVGASYMMSSRCALIRVVTQEFCNASNRSDLILKCQKMNDLYERPWIVIENEKKYRDCMNPDDVVVTSNHQLFGKEQRTKYIDGVLAQLSQSKIKVLFSESQKDTSGFIASVLKKESNKGFGLPKNLELSKRTEGLLPFYLSIPGVGLGTALHLIDNYRTPKDFIQSAQATMLRKSNLTDVEKVKKVQQFLRKTHEPLPTMKP